MTPRGTIDVPAEFASHAVVWAFRVAGECLAADGIHDGDYVLVDPGEPVADGDIAVIRYRGHQPVVKHLYRHGEGFRLVSSLPAVILTADDDPVVIGRVIGSVRCLEADGG
jgi:SOS-response transcriptional repressor LexA